ncbi:MAG TPA: ABC transporter substrate-binding protein [Candidatus Limnocylindria bacterium]|jgi:NitT/TauT family transport system substrate-binding protein|nr:ABC transporter substrate-binding protein [Candidatus Limnocylindria bacterium]
MRLRLAAIATVMAILSAACGGTPPAASSAPTSAATQSAAAASGTPLPCCKKVIAAYSNISADDWVMWYAFEKGIFKERGLEVDMQSISGGAQTSAALLANQIQVGQFGGSEALSGVAAGADLVVVGNMAPVYPYILYSQKAIKTLADLKGKKVGVSNKGGSSDIATRSALKANGFDPDKDVQILAVGSHANRTAALLNGSIDAGVDDPPEDEELVKAGLNPLIDLAAQKLPAANTGIIVQRAYLNANKDVIQAYVDATVIARSRMAKDKEGSVTVLKKYFKSDNTASMEKAYAFFIAGTSPVTPLYPFPAVEQFKDAVTILGADNDKIKTVDISKMIDTTFVKSAQDRKLGG